MTIYAGHKAVGFESPAPGGYHDWQATCDELRKLAADYPATSTYRPIGTTYERRDIPRLTVRGAAPARRTVLVVGCHHAREWISVEVPLAFAQRVAAHATDVQLLDAFDFVFVPMLNPDGHCYSTTATTRFWRKNRSEGDDFGVDLNRNYSVHWGRGLTSCNPSSDMFLGLTSFSEMETAAVRDLVRGITPDIVLSYHSYGEEVLFPWAFDPFVPRDPALEAGKSLAEAYAIGTGLKGNPYLTRALRDHYGEGIGVGGDMGDWVLTETAGACLPLTIELSPKTGNPGFVLPAADIPRVVAQNWDGLVKLLEMHRTIRP